MVSCCGILRYSRRTSKDERRNAAAGSCHFLCCRCNCPLCLFTSVISVYFLFETVKEYCKKILWKVCYQPWKVLAHGFWMSLTFNDRVRSFDLKSFSISSIWKWLLSSMLICKHRLKTVEQFKQNKHGLSYRPYQCPVRCELWAFWKLWRFTVFHPMTCPK